MPCLRRGWRADGSAPRCRKGAGGIRNRRQTAAFRRRLVRRNCVGAYIVRRGQARRAVRHPSLRADARCPRAKIDRDGITAYATATQTVANPPSREHVCDLTVDAATVAKNPRIHMCLLLRAKPVSFSPGGSLPPHARASPNVRFGPLSVPGCRAHVCGDANIPLGGMSGFFGTRGRLGTASMKRGPHGGHIDGGWPRRTPPDT